MELVAVLRVRTSPLVPAPCRHRKRMLEIDLEYLVRTQMKVDARYRKEN